MTSLFVIYRTKRANCKYISEYTMNILELAMYCIPYKEEYIVIFWP